jgi:hypothetical protein
MGLRVEGRRPRSYPAFGPGATIRTMPEALDVDCPSCGSHLKVDPDTGSVVWVSRLDEKFARSVEQTRHSKDILEKKFEEARKRAAENPNERPPNPFDNE